MANEVQFRKFLNIRKGNLDYRPPQVSWNMDMTGAKGPTPGAIEAPTDGVDVDLSALTDPGIVHIYNMEASGGSSISWGIHDPETDRYYPVGVLAPGEHDMLVLDEDFQSEHYPATGTALGPVTNRLYVKGKTAAANVYVGAFER